MSINDDFKLELNRIKSIKKPNLFLHACCGPCSTEVLNKLNEYFNIFIIFYNSNIDLYEEYNKRYNQFDTIKKFISFDNIKIIYNEYNHEEFLNAIKGLENEKEGGLRCVECFRLRLKKTYDIANDYIKKNKLDNEVNYITTTLTISPHKNALIINEILKDIVKGTNIKYLPSDFKKEDGYLKSIKFSKEYNLYRQNYCGCEFSKTQ